MADIFTFPWADLIPEGDFVSTAPTYEVGKFFDDFHEDKYVGDGDPQYNTLKYYFYDPTEHGYPKYAASTEHGYPKRDSSIKDSNAMQYPLLIFLHGTSNALVGTTCINYTGAELYASPEYQTDFGGAYILVPVANEYQGEEHVEGAWCEEYVRPLYGLIKEFINKHTDGVGNKFLFGNSSGATMTMRMGENYTDYFDALIPVGTTYIPDKDIRNKLDENDVKLFFAIGQKDEFHPYDEEIAPILDDLKAMKNCFIFMPEWVRNGDHGISSINAGFEMGQHCLMNAVQSNLKFDDGTPMDERLPRGMTGWIDEVNRGSAGRVREYAPHGGYLKTGHVKVDENISLYYEEYGKGDNVVISAQVGFYHRGMQQRMAELGYHVYCITLRGFHPSSLVTDDYKERWYDIFASDVVAFADKMGIDRFVYMGASHGAGVGWHLMLQAKDRVDAFIAVVAGPHSLKEDTMSYRQMLEQGIIKEVPPFDSPIEDDTARKQRRAYRDQWILEGTKISFPEEARLDYGRPMMRFGTEENLCEALKTITVPVLYIGGNDDPISTPELMMRTLNCLPHCKMVLYTNCGHNIDTDLIEEVSDEADRFIKNAKKTGKYYLPVEG